MKRICEIEINFKGDQIIDGTKFHMGQFLAYIRDFDPTLPGSFDINFAKIVDTASEILSKDIFGGLKYESITIRFGENEGTVGDNNFDLNNIIAERNFKVALDSEEFEMIDFVCSNVL